MEAVASFRAKRVADTDALDFFKALGLADPVFWSKGDDQYFHVAEHDRARIKPGKRGSDDTATALLSLWADIDYFDPEYPEHHKKPPKLTRAECLAAISEIPLAPSVIVDSGGGFHVYWKLIEPLTDMVAAETLSEHWQAYLRENFFAGMDSTFDLARVLRVPGTTNSKNGAVVEVIESSGKTYSPEDFAFEATATSTRIKTPVAIEETIKAQPLLTGLVALARRKGLSEGQALKLATGALAAVDSDLTNQKSPEDIARAAKWSEKIVAEEDYESDGGYARRMIAWSGEKIRHVQEIGWLVWNGEIWEKGSAAKVAIHRIAQETAAEAIIRAALEIDHEKKKKKLSAAIKAENASRIQGMITEAAPYPEVALAESDLDSDRYLLTVKNGTINLETGELLPFDPKHLITRQAEASYYPEAESKIWKKFLAKIMNDDPEMIDFLARAVGYSLCGSMGEEKLFIPYGSGANGKSRFLGAVRGMMGSYAGYIRPAVLLAKRAGRVDANNATPAVMALEGRRFLNSIETSEEAALDEEMIKSVTSGDPVSGRHLHAEEITFQPEGKLWLGTNHRPRIHGTDIAIWRRISMIPFDVYIPPEDRDQELEQKLAGEHDGILRWAVDGFRDWNTRGLMEPKKVLAATEIYRLGEDLAARFVAECCSKGVGKTDQADLQKAQNLWAKAEGERSLKRRKLGERLESLGYVVKRERGHGNMVQGLSLNPEWIAQIQEIHEPESA